ncbi:MAG: type II toxin-antitoxin system VapC family toxin [Thermoleophilaceae bacterium]|nr:type II toxin-antitoxin system VapC family toxin [Thermoleophilaceae bacterium]
MRPGRYLDSSALVKLVLDEPESAALDAYLAGSPLPRASAALARVEVVRAVRPHGDAAVVLAREMLETVELVAVTEPLLDAAAELRDPTLRSLDAIHVAAALVLGEDLAELITYDRQMAAAAETLGIAVASPG